MPGFFSLLRLQYARTHSWGNRASRNSRWECFETVAVGQLRGRCCSAFCAKCELSHTSGRRLICRCWFALRTFGYFHRGCCGRRALCGAHRPAERIVESVQSVPFSSLSALLCLARRVPRPGKRG